MRTIKNYETKNKPYCEDETKKPCIKCSEKKFHNIENKTKK